MNDEIKTIYIAGKITGDPSYREKFAAAEQSLKDMGIVVLSPTILPERGFGYPALMRMCSALLAECDAVYFLPGWTASTGACYENELANVLGIRRYFDPISLERDL